MGRKNTKAKDKKMKRKEEEEMMQTKRVVVDAANAQEDPLAALVAFKKYERNGLNLTISCEKAPNLDADTTKWAFSLTKSNMEDLYIASGWGWSDKQKKDEMTDDAAWYLIARDDNKLPVALVHFRFDMDFDDEVVYCYEVQLTESVRRKGLGKFLVQILQLLAHKNKMTKLMCTIFKENTSSKKFFMDKLNFTVDETSPEDTYAEAFYIEEKYSYLILSKLIGPKAKTTPAQNGHTSCAEACKANGVSCH